MAAPPHGLVHFEAVFEKLGQLRDKIVAQLKLLQFVTGELTTSMRTFSRLNLVASSQELDTTLP